ncbi:hypothetical protein lerEdw1_004765 [Lerista edwardsae]|nr:hypothetical protein lerEdw1_004765 [Lerista edwardsae]
MERDRGPRGSAVDLGFGALSTPQLRALMRDETWLERIVKLSRKFQNLQLEREMRLASNYALARQNLALQPRLETGKASLAIKYQELRELREACRDKQQRLGACMEKWTPENAVGRLQAELSGVEAKVEVRQGYGEQMEQFLCWDLPAETFVESFQHSRRLSHLRRTQLEKLQEILKLEKEKTPDKPSPSCEEPPAAPPAPPAPPAVAHAAPAPKVFQLRLAPAFLIPSEAVLPLPVAAAAPQKCCLPTLSTSHSTASFVSSPLSLIGHIHLPQAHLPHAKKKEPPHR